MVLGLSDVIAGAAGAVTVSVAVFDAALPGFVTCTVQVRAVTPTVTSTCTCVAVTLAMKLPCCTRVVLPLVRVTVKPGWKPVPVMVSVWLAADPVMGFGLSDAIAGVTGAVTVRLTAFELPALGFTTCTVHVRAVVPTFTSTWICVAVRLVMALPVYGTVVPPAARFTVSPGWKPLPLMVRNWLALEAVMVLGLSDEITGAAGAETVRLAALDGAEPGFVTCTVQVRAVVPTVTVARICVAVRLVTGALTAVPPV